MSPLTITVYTYVLISSLLESYPSRCLGNSLTLSVTLSVQCVATEIKYSSQILQFCSKLGWSFRHSVSFQCLFKLRNFYYDYLVSCHLYLNWTNISLMDTSLVVSIFISFFFLFFSIQIRRRGVSVHCRSKCQSMESIKSLFNSNTTFSTFVSVSVMF